MDGKIKNLFFKQFTKIIYNLLSDIYVQYIGLYWLDLMLVSNISCLSFFHQEAYNDFLENYMTEECAQELHQKIVYLIKLS